MNKRKLMTYLKYNRTTGVFTWKETKSKKIKKGTVAGYAPNKKETLRVTINLKKYQLTRLAWLWCYGEYPKGCLTHINKDRWDNRISNLKLMNTKNEKTKKKKDK